MMLYEWEVPNIGPVSRNGSPHCVFAVVQIPFSAIVGEWAHDFKFLITLPQPVVSDACSLYYIY